MLSREQALAKTAFALMTGRGVTPTLDNFISERRPFTHDNLEGLRRRSLASARTIDAIDNARTNVMATLNAVLEKIEARCRLTVGECAG